MTLEVQVVRLPAAEGLPLPGYQSIGSAGVDLMAAIEENSVIILEPNAREVVPTGLAFAIPPGYEAQIRPRSGLAMRHGITVLNAPGTIDSDYRGEIGVLLVNLGSEAFQITRGIRIAQAVFAPVSHANFIETDQLNRTGRGSGGFGSTGLS